MAILECAFLSKLRLFRIGTTDFTIRPYAVLGESGPGIAFCISGPHLRHSPYTDTSFLDCCCKGTDDIQAVILKKASLAKKLLQDELLFQGVEAEHPTLYFKALNDVSIPQRMA